MNEQAPQSDSDKPGPRPFRSEPKLELCRAKKAGFGDYVDCLTFSPERCLHSLRFGDGHLCLHPGRQEIANRTRELLGGD